MYILVGFLIKMYHYLIVKLSPKFSDFFGRKRKKKRNGGGGGEGRLPLNIFLGVEVFSSGFEKFSGVGIEKFSGGEVEKFSGGGRVRSFREGGIVKNFFFFGGGEKFSGRGLKIFWGVENFSEGVDKFFLGGGGVEKF